MVCPVDQSLYTMGKISLTQSFGFLSKEGRLINLKEAVCNGLKNHLIGSVTSPFCTCNGFCKDITTNLKGKTKSSQEWLKRQLKDPYVEKAKLSNYRCRSAFKLLEIDDKHKILSPGQYAVDCGAAPGSWTQVLVERTNSLGMKRKTAKGHVVAVDRLPIYPLVGATVLGCTDFTTEAAQKKILEVLDGRKVDVVLSDMAPNATGVRMLDQENIMQLAYCALRFSVQVSVIGGTFLVKIWDGGDASSYENDLRKFYSIVKSVKPKASRADSAEKFFLAKGFKGLM